MKRSHIFLSILFSVTILFFASCHKNNLNPNIPNVNIHISLNPNSTEFLELNTVGGWAYLDEKPSIYIPPGSRGIIVWRMDMTHFKAYERQPPNDPFKCCNENYTLCGKLIVGDNYPFVKDTCTGTSYQLLDGSIFDGPGQYPLIEYAAEYDGYILYIHN